MSMPEISVIMPVYNNARHLASSIQSFLDQTMDARLLELVVVDDCSQDESWGVLQDYARRHDRIRPFQLEAFSRAAGKARNVALDQARGRYVMFLDADDRLLPEACEMLYDSATQTGAPTAAGWMVQAQGNDRRLPGVYSTFTSAELRAVRIEDHPELLWTPPAIFTRIVDRRFLDEKRIRFPEGVIAQDAVFAAEVLLQAPAVTAIPKVVCEHAIRSAANDRSVSFALDHRYFEDYLSTREMIREIYRKTGRVKYERVRYPLDLRYLLQRLIEYLSSASDPSVDFLADFTEFASLDDQGALGNQPILARALRALIADGCLAGIAELGRMLGVVTQHDRRAP